MGDVVFRIPCHDWESSQNRRGERESNKGRHSPLSLCPDLLRSSLERHFPQLSDYWDIGSQLEFPRSLMPGNLGLWWQKGTCLQRRDFVMLPVCLTTLQGRLELRQWWVSRGWTTADWQGPASYRFCLSYTKTHQDTKLDTGVTPTLCVPYPGVIASNKSPFCACHHHLSLQSAYWGCTMEPSVLGLPATTPATNWIVLPRWTESFELTNKISLFQLQLFLSQKWPNWPLEALYLGTLLLWVPSVNTCIF